MRKFVLPIVFALSLSFPVTGAADTPPPEPVQVESSAALTSAGLLYEVPLLTVTATPAVAAPTEVPETDAEVGGAVSLLIDAIQNGNWSILVGALILLLIWLVRKMGWLDMLPKNAIPWVSAGIGVVGYVGIALASGLPWKEALGNGFAAGIEAVGLWELLFKRLLAPSKDAEETAVVPTPDSGEGGSEPEPEPEGEAPDETPDETEPEVATARGPTGRRGTTIPST